MDLYWHLLHDVHYLAPFHNLRHLLLHLHIFWLTDYMRHTHLNLLHLLPCLVDIVRHFHHALHFHVLLLTGLDNALDLFYLHHFHYPINRNLLHHFFTLV